MKLYKMLDGTRLDTFKSRTSLGSYVHVRSTKHCFHLTEAARGRYDVTRVSSKFSTRD